MTNIVCSWDDGNPTLASIIKGGTTVSQAEVKTNYNGDNLSCIDICTQDGFNYAGTQYGYNCGESSFLKSCSS
jgi:hypothetical protein